MNEPVLVIMAAGIGSRYGGLKQMEPIGPNGEAIIDYSVFDAKRAGFKKAVIIIKKEIEEDFKKAVGHRLEKAIDVTYAFQDIADIPKGFSVPEERKKPWGTCHAVLSARDFINAPFAVINSDDYYGPSAFKAVYDFLKSAEDKDKYDYAMVGYRLGNTLTENGHVARGICSADEKGFLTGIVERTRIEKRGEGAAFTLDDGKTYTDIDVNSTVSMNLWGFTRSFIDEALSRFPKSMEKILSENPLKGEYFLPTVVNELLAEDKATVRVLKSLDRWYGVTYKEDKDSVVSAIKSFHENGTYPQKLW